MKKVKTVKGKFLSFEKTTVLEFKSMKTIIGGNPNNGGISERHLLTRPSSRN
jgi:hypothetical protein